MYEAQRQEVRERAAVDQLKAELEGLMLEMHAIVSGDPWRERYEPRERVERLCVEWAYRLLTWQARQGVPVVTANHGDR